jgi:GNAT superfamily N-acetyltransferase
MGLDEADRGVVSDRMKKLEFDLSAFVSLTTFDYSLIREDLGKLTRPWEFATYKYKGIKVGKAMMIAGPSWYGVIDLKGSSLKFAKEYLGLSRMNESVEYLEGGPGSGHYGHKGLKGVWGGSSKSGGGSLLPSERTDLERFQDKFFSGPQDAEKHWKEKHEQDSLKRLFGENWKYITPDILRGMNEVVITLEDGTKERLTVSGFSYRLNAIDNRLSFSGTLLNSKGEDVGEFSREFFLKPTLGRIGDPEKSLSVYQKSLNLHPDYQGKNFAREYAKSVFPLYLTLGVRFVEVSAGGDIGKYAWAKFGFDFASESDLESYRERLNEGIRELSKTSSPFEREQFVFGIFGSMSVARSVISGRMKEAGFDFEAFLGLNSSDFSRIIEDIDKLNHPWEFASYKYKEIKLGKVMMLAGPTWRGTIDLKGNSWKFAKEYLGIK